MGKPNHAPPTNPNESAQEGEWQSANTTRNNRTRNGMVVGIAFVVTMVMVGWLWQMQEQEVPINIIGTPSATALATSLSTATANVARTVVPTRRTITRNIATPTPERYGILSLLQVEQMSPIQAGQPMTVRMQWRVGALPNIGLHHGLFSLKLVGPTGAELAHSHVASEGPMRGYRVGSVYSVLHTLDVPTHTIGGQYVLMAGISDLATGERWPALMDGQINADYQLKALQFLLPRKGWGALVWPVFNTTIQQGYGSQHPALDIQEEGGQPVFAAMRGCVVAPDPSKQDTLDYGDAVEIKRDGDSAAMDVRVRYAYLEALQVKIGDCVMPGDVIGEVAASPRSIRGDSKLRVEVLVNGQAQNPWDSFIPIAPALPRDIANTLMPKRYPLTLNAVQVAPLQPKAGEPITISWWFSGSANSVSVRVYDSDANHAADYLHSTPVGESQRGEKIMRGMNANRPPAAIGLLVDHTLLALVPLGAMALEAITQPFEHGSMIWLQGRQEIYVLYENGEMQRFVDHFAEGQPEAALATPPPAGKLQPQRRFGWVWRTNRNVRERLGWAQQAEQDYRACVRWLYPAGGAMKQPIYVTDPNGQVYQFGIDDGGWRYSPGLLGAQPC